MDPKKLSQIQEHTIPTIMQANLEIIQKLKEITDKEFDFQRNYILKSADEHSFFLDKAILTISTAGIGAILALVSSKPCQANLFYTGSPWQARLFFATLISFGSAILINLFSFYFARKYFPVQFSTIVNWYKKRSDAISDIDISQFLTEQKGVSDRIQESPNLDNVWKQRMDWCNNWASVSLFIGIVFGVCFVITFYS